MKYLLIVCGITLFLIGCQASVSMQYPKNKASANAHAESEAYESACKAALQPACLAYEWIDFTDGDDPNDFIFPHDWQDEDDE